MTARDIAHTLHTAAAQLAAQITAGAFAGAADSSVFDLRKLSLFLLETADRIDDASAAAWRAPR